MTEWRSKRLAVEHDVEKFDCGVHSLNKWLHSHARQAVAAGTAAVYVWTAVDSPEVVAYYAIAPTQVTREQLSNSMAGGASAVPGYILAKLAIHNRLRGQGLGEEVLLDAIERIVGASERAGGRVIVVDALNDSVATFYTRYGFQPVIGAPNRLVMKASTARKALNIGTLNVSASRSAGLVSMVLNRPDGSVAPLVCNPDEARRVAEEMIEAAQEQKGSGEEVQIDLRLVMTRALSRDPFTD